MYVYTYVHLPYHSPLPLTPPNPQPNPTTTPHTHTHNKTKQQQSVWVSTSSPSPSASRSSSQTRARWPTPCPPAPAAAAAGAGARGCVSLLGRQWDGDGDDNAPLSPPPLSFQYFNPSRAHDQSIPPSLRFSHRTHTRHAHGIRQVVMSMLSLPLYKQKAGWSDSQVSSHSVS